MSRILKMAKMALCFAVGLASAPAADVGVSIKHISAKFVFDPTNVVVRAGDRVVWRNIEPTVHDTTHAGQPRLWQSGNMGLNATFAYTFTNLGYYPYVCLQHIVSHPEQTGSVSVVSVVITNQQHIPGGGFEFTIQGGRQGLKSVVEGGSGLGTWAPLATNTFPTNGIIRFTNNGALPEQRFYRSRLIP